MDHFVDVGDGQKIHIPLRVIQNDGGAEVMLTLFRQPGMDAEKFAADARWIHRDLKALKALIEGQSRPRSEEHTSDLQSLMRSSYAVFCLKKTTKTNRIS